AVERKQILEHAHLHCFAEGFGRGRGASQGSCCSSFSPCGRRWREAPDEGFFQRAGIAERIPHPPPLRSGTFSYKERREEATPRRYAETRSTSRWRRRRSAPGGCGRPGNC